MSDAKELQTGVYCIRNKVNGKVYVGSAAVSLKRRQGEHFRQLSQNRHFNIYLQSAWNKYGADAFEFLVVERCLRFDCTGREQYWINQYRSAERAFGYNVCPTAGGVLGRTHSPKTKAKMSASARARFERTGHPWVGRKQSEETKAKISAANKGQNLGGTLSTETRAKLSTTRLGRKHSPETRAKLSAAHMGHPVSDETRAKVAATKRARSRITLEMIEAMRMRYVPGDSVHGGNALAKEFGISRCAVQKLVAKYHKESTESRLA